MKKCLMVLLLILLLAVTPFAAEREGKRMNLLVGIGTASSDSMGGRVLELGLEKQFSGNLYGQFLFEYYDRQNYIYFDSDPGSYACVFNLYSVYKKPLSKTFNVFFKAGLHLALVEEEQDAFYVNFDLPVAAVGFGGGTGFEFYLCERFALYSGLSFKMNFTGDHINWLKLNVGLNFRLK